MCNSCYQCEIMNLTFNGAAQTVTGSNSLIEVGSKKILVDCGLYQGGSDSFEKNKAEFSFDPTEIDYCVLTHAHIDHTGRVPQLLKRGFQGKIISTPPTEDFARILLEDSQEILARQAQKQGYSLLYSKENIEQAQSCWETMGYDTKKELDSNVKLRLRDAGHVLGSASIELWLQEEDRGRKVVFSGDLGNYPTPLIPDPEFLERADYIVLESTYGNRIHEDVEERRDKLEDVVENIVGKEGTLMVPSFALERTQELLYELNSLVENNRIPQVPVYLDSPLAIKLTKAYKNYPEYFSEEARKQLKAGEDFFDFPQFEFTPEVKDSKEINNVEAPKVIIAGSGMSTGGRILHHEKRYLPSSDNVLLIIAYQVPGTLGRRILDGETPVQIMGEKIDVNARVKSIGGYSSHSDQPRLVHWVRSFSKRKIRKVFVNHGEESGASALVQRIKDFHAIPAESPPQGKTYSL